MPPEKRGCKYKPREMIHLVHSLSSYISSGKDKGIKAILLTVPMIINFYFLQNRSQIKKTAYRCAGGRHLMMLFRMVLSGFPLLGCLTIMYEPPETNLSCCATRSPIVRRPRIKIALPVSPRATSRPRTWPHRRHLLHRRHHHHHRRLLHCLLRAHRHHRPQRDCRFIHSVIYMNVDRVEGSSIFRCA